MKVILLQELKGKGGEGDVIDVADGFANNYLLTEGLAIKATKGNLKQLEQRKHNIAKREETRLEDAAKMKEALEKATVKVVAQVGDEGQLFGSVTTQMIADACKEQADIDVDKRRIELGKPIKTAGEHEVTVSIYRDIKGTIKVRVVGEGLPSLRPLPRSQKRWKLRKPPKKRPKRPPKRKPPNKRTGPLLSRSRPHMSKKLYPQPRAVETVENPLCPGWWAKGVSSQWWITAHACF